MRSDRHIKTTLATLVSSVLAVAITLAVVAAAWADPAPLARAEAGSAASGAAGAAVRSNPDEQTNGLTRATPSRPSVTTSVVRPNPHEQPPPTAPATIMRVTDPGDGFDWAAAGIGAAIGFALSLLSIGSITALSRRRAGPSRGALSS
ncbi:MAG TPA: hypothetical protein VFI54_03745 [Solirubrobacteraceae bacterium]|nr:hypothetical protein [Solirubrobacteraceae bacterium]